MSNQGFSLLEVLLYMALASLLVGVGLRTGYSFVEQGYAAEETILNHMDIQFISYKVDDVLQRAQTVVSPAVGEVSTILELRMFDGEHVLVGLQDASLVVTREGRSELISSPQTIIELFEVYKEAVQGRTVTKVSMCINGQTFNLVRYDDN